MGSRHRNNVLGYTAGRADVMNWEQAAGWVTIGSGALGMLIAGVLWVMSQRRQLRASVFANLDNAYAMGQFDPLDGYLHGMTPDDIAYDLTCYAADLEHRKHSELRPYVLQWMQYRGLA